MKCDYCGSKKEKKIKSLNQSVLYQIKCSNCGAIKKTIYKKGMFF